MTTLHGALLLLLEYWITPTENRGAKKGSGSSIDPRHVLYVEREVFTEYLEYEKALQGQMRSVVTE